MNVETLLYEAIEEAFNQLNDMDNGSDERKAKVDELAKLMDRAIEMEKIDIDCKNKAKALEVEQNFKQQQMIDEKHDRLVKNVISVAGVVLPLAVTIWGTIASFKFEKEDSISTIMGRGYIQKLLPKK